MKTVRHEYSCANSLIVICQVLSCLVSNRFDCTNRINRADDTSTKSSKEGGEHAIVSGSQPSKWKAAESNALVSATIIPFDEIRANLPVDVSDVPPKNRSMYDVRLGLL